MAGFFSLTIVRPAFDILSGTRKIDHSDLAFYLLTWSANVGILPGIQSSRMKTGNFCYLLSTYPDFACLKENEGRVSTKTMRVPQNKYGKLTPGAREKQKLHTEVMCMNVLEMHR